MIKGLACRNWTETMLLKITVTERGLYRIALYSAGRSIISSCAGRLDGNHGIIAEVVL